MSSQPASPQGRALRLSSFLPYRLNVVSAVASEGLARAYQERFGLGVPEWRVLATVTEFGSITAKAIGLHAHMGKVKVSRAAGALEARGLISRVPNREDLRESFLVLTAAGRAIYEEIEPLALAYVARLTEGFDAQELVLLDGLIDRLLDRAATIEKESADS